MNTEHLTDIGPYSIPMMLTFIVFAQQNKQTISDHKGLHYLVHRLHGGKIQGSAGLQILQNIPIYNLLLGSISLSKLWFRMKGMKNIIIIV